MTKTETSTTYRLEALTGEHGWMRLHGSFDSAEAAQAYLDRTTTQAQAWRIAKDTLTTEYVEAAPRPLVPVQVQPACPVCGAQDPRWNVDTRARHVTACVEEWTRQGVDRGPLYRGEGR